MTEFIKFSIGTTQYHSFIMFHGGAFHSYVYEILNLCTKEREQKSFSDGVTAIQQRDDRILELANGQEIQILM